MINDTETATYIVHAEHEMIASASPELASTPAARQSPFGAKGENGGPHHLFVGDMNAMPAHGPVDSILGRFTHEVTEGFVMQTHEKLDYDRAHSIATNAENRVNRSTALNRTSITYTLRDSRGYYFNDLFRDMSGGIWSSRLYQGDPVTNIIGNSQVKEHN